MVPLAPQPAITRRTPAEPGFTVDAGRIVKWPLITYRQGITGRSRIDEAFKRKGLTPDVVLSAQDSDVIKTYVELGLGIGTVAEQSGGEYEAGNLVRLDTRHLFDANTVWLGLKRGQLQRNYVWRFIELCNAGLSVDEIKRRDGAGRGGD